MTPRIQNHPDQLHGLFSYRWDQLHDLLECAKGFHPAVCGILCRRTAGRPLNLPWVPERVQDFVLFLFIPIVWGLNFIVIKSALAQFASPESFNALRWILATGILLALVAVRRDSLRIAPRDWGWILFIAIVGSVLQQVTFINGIHLTTAGHSALILGLTPVMVALAGGILGFERVGRRMWAGILLSVLGLALLVRPQGSGLPEHAFTGDLLNLASAACWALYSVGSRPLALRYPPAAVAAITVALSTVVLVAIAAPAFPAERWGEIRWTAWADVLYSGGLTIAFGYVVWTAALRRLGSARTAIVANLNPVVAVGAAWILLGERLGAWQALGAVLVLIGIGLTRR